MNNNIEENNGYYITKLIENDTYFIHELNMENLGNAIREVRQKRGLTIAQLANRVHIPAATISKIETNSRKGRLETILKIFEGLHVKIFFQIELQHHWRKAKHEKLNKKK